MSTWKAFSKLDALKSIPRGLLILLCVHAKSLLLLLLLLSHFSHVRLFETLWTIAHQAPLSMEFSRWEYWSGLLVPIFLTQGSNLHFLKLVQCRWILKNPFWVTGEFPLYITHENIYFLICIQFSSVAQSCLTLCDPMNRSTPGLPVHHQNPGVHSDSRSLSWWCHPAISSSVVPFSSCPQSSQHQRLFQCVSSSHEVAKVLEFQL